MNVHYCQTGGRCWQDLTGHDISQENNDGWCTCRVLTLWAGWGLQVWSQKTLGPPHTGRCRLAAEWGPADTTRSQERSLQCTQKSPGGSVYCSSCVCSPKTSSYHSQYEVACQETWSNLFCLWDRSFLTCPLNILLTTCSLWGYTGNNRLPLSQTDKVSGHMVSGFLYVYNYEESFKFQHVTIY